MNITVQMVKELRERTGAGVLEAKKTLEVTGGDFDEAVKIMREKGAARADKRASRAAEEGVIESYIHPGSRVGVMLELNCETDFVARNEEFVALAHDLALHIAAESPRYVSQADVPVTVIEEETERIAAQAKAEGKPEPIVEKIVSGRLAKFYAENCLLEQPFVKDADISIKQLLTEAIGKTGENIIVRRFARYELGKA
jgi:elongation factor Ts